MTQVLQDRMRKNDLRDINLRNISMNGSVRIKRMFKNRIIWNNNMQLEERSSGVK